MSPHHKNLQIYRPTKEKPPTLFSFALHLQWGNQWDSVKTFDWEVLLTQGQYVWTAFCKIYSGTPHLTIFCAPKYTPKYAYLAIFSILAILRVPLPVIQYTMILKVSRRRTLRCYPHVNNILMSLLCLVLLCQNIWLSSSKKCKYLDLEGGYR